MSRAGNVLHVLIGVRLMLARKKVLHSEKWGDVGSTPMLVPSLSSRVNIEYKKTLDVLSEVITGPFLLSAYDFYHTDPFPKITFSELVFFDSGGYESAVEKEVEEFGLYKPDPFEWTREKHIEAINRFDEEIPKVIISYDHPSERMSVAKQIDYANDLFRGREGIIKEILIKPETENSRRIKLSSFFENIERIQDFDILGFTEKELGKSVLDRMIAIAKIRQKLEDSHIDIPLHIFGSLDTLTTPLYYISGADIFDGLSWLRFVFDEGATHYINTYGPEKFGIHENSDGVWIRSVYQNYNYLGRLKINLEHFQSTEDFTKLGNKAGFFESAFNDLNEKMGGVL
jgi:hypothetical protein